MIGVGCVEITDREKTYVNRVLESGLLTSGPVLDKFEEDFAARHGAKYGLMVNSGTDALRVALAAVREFHHWDFDDEVIVPALTFIASSNVIFQNDLTPIFVDVDPVTFNIDPVRIEEAITEKTKAIMVVHLFGLPCDMGPIMRIARAYNLLVIEDSCEAMGVNYNGKPVGSFGDIACFSTYAAHIITTGVGGLAITTHPGYAELMRSYANHGRDPIFFGFRDSPTLNPGKYLNPSDRIDVINRRFRFERMGYSSRATQLEAALGLAQLERLDDIVFQRANNFTFLASRLHGDPAILLQDIPEGREHAGMMFPIVLVDPEIDRDKAMQYLDKRGIESRPFFNILGQPAYEGFGYDEAEFPVATRLSRRGFYVGCHQSLSSSDLWQIADSVKDCIKAKAKVSL